MKCLFGTTINFFTLNFISLGVALGAVKTGEFTFEIDGKKYQGFIASGASEDQQAPGELVVHEWWGHNDYPRKRAKELAQAGFVAFAVDMFGQGKSDKSAGT
jgi:dienelactone hydrolase